MSSEKREEKPFVPNPKSKTPLTDEMMFHVRKLQKEEESDWDIEKAIEKFAIPTEKQDIVAMYLACKTNDLGDKKEAVFEQMKLLFKNVPDVKGIIEDEEAKEEAKRKAREEALLEWKEKEARRKLIKILLIIAAIVIYVAILFVLCVK